MKINFSHRVERPTTIIDCISLSGGCTLLSTQHMGSFLEQMSFEVISVARTLIDTHSEPGISFNVRNLEKE